MYALYISHHATAIIAIIHRLAAICNAGHNFFIDKESSYIKRKEMAYLLSPLWVRIMYLAYTAFLRRKKHARDIWSMEHLYIES